MKYFFSALLCLSFSALAQIEKKDEFEPPSPEELRADLDIIRRENNRSPAVNEEDRSLSRKDPHYHSHTEKPQSSGASNQ